MHPVDPLSGSMAYYQLFDFNNGLNECIASGGWSMQGSYQHESNDRRVFG
jgi:hypothetical protein